MPRSYKTDLFQKRQYEWLAETIKGLDVETLISQYIADDRSLYDMHKAVKDSIAQQFARALSGSNPGYDRERFLNACKPDDEPEEPDEPEMGPGCAHGPPLPRGARCSLCED